MEESGLPFSDLGVTLMQIVRSSHYTSHAEIIERLNVGKDELYEILLELSDNGFEFDTHPHAGVKLVDIPVLLTPQRVASSLSTEKIGKIVHHSTSAESTNSQAIELASQSSPEGTLVITEYQSKGRGRLKRKWQAPPFSSILATLLLRPVSRLLGPLVPLVTALTIVELLRQRGMDAYIRWPNDIVVKGRKICGILTEMGTNYTVCGFGLNINQSSFYPQLDTSATSIRLELNRSYSRVALLTWILQRFEERYEDLLSGKDGKILEQIRHVSSLIGRRTRVFTGDSVVTGYVQDIDDSGALVLKQDRGRVVTISPQRASLLEGIQ